MRAPAVAPRSDALQRATTFEQLRNTVLTAARRIAGADGATFVLRDGDCCFYVAEDAIGPLWAGQRFPVGECISGWAMLHCAPAEIADIRTDDRIPQEAYRPTFIRSLVMVPMGETDPPGAIGLYWSTTGSHLDDEGRVALRWLGAQCGTAVSRLGLDAAPWAPNFALARSA